jgi:elongation factor G
MKVYPTNKIRNVALVSHQGSGKTSLAEVLLFNTGAINRLGDVQQGNTISDFDDEEIKRGMSISTSLIPLEVDDNKINVLDTPGYTDFMGEVKSALRVVEAAIVLVDASAGVEVGTELVWSYAGEYSLPRIVVINKMDREVARHEQVLERLRQLFDVRFVPLQLPMGSEGDFPGVIDLVKMKARVGPEDAEQDIPTGLAEAAEEARVAVIEAAAEADDALLEKYFEGEELTDAEVTTGLRTGFAQRSFVPIVYAAATANIGVKSLTEVVNTLVPSPAEAPSVVAEGPTGEVELAADDSGPLAVYVFKTTADPYVGKLTYFRIFSGLLQADSRYYNATRGEEERLGTLYVMCGKEQLNVDMLHAGDIGAVAKLGHTVTGDTLCDKGSPLQVPPPIFPLPVYAVAVSPVTQADSAKMGPTLTRLCEEDLTLQWRQDLATKEAVLEGMGDVHIDVVMHRAARLGASLEARVPRVPYQETVTRTYSTQYRHKKQTGGAGQFAEVHLRVEPLERGEGFTYASEVFGGAISSSFIPSIEKGVKQVLEQGVIAGYPVVDIKAVVYDGKEHPVDSKDIAFQIAGREVFKLAVQGAGPVLLEPIMTVRVTVPESNMGDVMGDLSSRRAQIQGTEAEAGHSIITALVPLAEIQRYSNDLRSITQGRGVFTMEFSHYQQVPQHLTEGVVEATKRRVEKED